MNATASPDLVNVAGHLARMAEQQPGEPAVILQRGLDRHETCSFKELDAECDALAAGLAAIGIGRGTRTALMVKPSRPFFALTFALLKMGAVPIFIDPGMGIKNLGRCLNEAEPEAFIGIPKAHLARIALGWAKRTVRTLVTVGPRLLWGGHAYRKLLADGAKRLPYRAPEMAAHDTAALLFTSGSTGAPKGAVYTHGIFAAQVDALRSVYGIQPGERDLATFPLFALFGPALGMTAVVPDMDPTRPAQADPQRLIAAIEQWSATNMFGSPALLDTLSRYGEAQQRKLPTLKRVLSAGAPARTVVLKRMQAMLPPGVEIFTPYGATEALPVCSVGTATILGETAEQTARGKGVCVGPPVGDIEARIIRIDDDPIEQWSDELVLPDGDIGEIAVRGPVVTQGYYGRPEADRLSKIAGDDGRAWHRMGDVGYRDAEGRLWMCGRKSHRVQTNDGTLFTIPCEAIFNEHPWVFRSALVGVGTPPAQQPVLFVEVEKNVRADLVRLKQDLLSLAQQHNLTRGIETIRFHPAFPVDIRHNAKIFREKLAVLAESAR